MSPPLLNAPPPPPTNTLPSAEGTSRTGPFARLLNELDVLGNAVDQVHANLETKYQAIENRARSAAAAVATANQQVASNVDQLTAGTATALDDLLARLDGYDNAWTVLIKDAIAQMQEGILSGEEFLSKFGDFTITLGGEVTTIAEMLQGMNLDVYEQRVQQLIRFLHENELTIQEILARLKESTSQYSQELAKSIELFLAKKLTLEELLRQAERLKDVVGSDSEGGALAEELLEALRGGHY